MKRRDALMIVEAAKGHRAAACGLIRRAVKAAGLTVLSFVSAREAKSYGLPEARFVVECTDEECAKLREIGHDMAVREGWLRFPVDMYHD